MRMAGDSSGSLSENAIPLQPGGARANSLTSNGFIHSSKLKLVLAQPSASSYIVGAPPPSVITTRYRSAPRRTPLFEPLFEQFRTPRPHTSLYWLKGHSFFTVLYPFQRFGHSYFITFLTRTLFAAFLRTRAKITPYFCALCKSLAARAEIGSI